MSVENDHSQCLAAIAGLAALGAGLGGAGERAAGLQASSSTVASTVPDNGDLNPYAVFVAPVSSGMIEKGDVIVDNFNNVSNLQGTGGTIVLVNPATRAVKLFAKLPQNLLAMPRRHRADDGARDVASGWVIVGSTPSTDGTTATKGPGCLLVFDSNGKLATVWSGAQINDPWGNMAVVDNGDTATLFVSMSGFDLPGPDKLDPATREPVIVRKATFCGSTVKISPGAPPKVTGRTVVGERLRAARRQGRLPDRSDRPRADRLDALCVRRRRQSRRGDSRRAEAGGKRRDGPRVTQDGMLQRPLALIATPDGHLMTTNAKNGQIVEIDPAERQAGRRAMGGHQPGAAAAGQRRSVRLGAGARGRRDLYVRRRHEHAGESLEMNGRPDGATRRGFLSALAGGARLAGLRAARRAGTAGARRRIEPFYGAHQAGVVTSAQTHAYFAAFDLTTDKRAEVAALMRGLDRGRRAARRRRDASRRGDGDYAAEPDGAEMTGLDPARLTITFGFGPSLFVKRGQRPFRPRKLRPEAFVDLPNFPGEQLAPARTGGDLIVQFCADNPQVAFHAARALGGRAYGVAAIRWVQSGFVSDYGPGKTPRNLMGFKDGTGNPHTDDPKDMHDVVWAGDEAPIWMRGGSYVVDPARAHGARTLGANEGRLSGADFRAAKALRRAARQGRRVRRRRSRRRRTRTAIRSSPKIRMSASRAAPREAGMRVLRRSYSYNDGANMTAERWPPWRQGMEFDAGLVFVCFQRDLRTGFIPIFENMSRFDMMNQFVTNTGGGHWACPGGAREGDYDRSRVAGGLKAIDEESGYSAALVALS